MGASPRIDADQPGSDMMRALVVDDATVMRKVLIGALARVGITDVVQAADGREGVGKALSEDFDIVFMDWNMPNLLGIDAVRVLRASGKTMPIIMVSTEANRARVEEAVAAGATNYIIKPFNPITTVAKIRDVLGEV